MKVLVDENIPLMTVDELRLKGFDGTDRAVGKWWGCITNWGVMFQTGWVAGEVVFLKAWVLSW